MLQSDIRQKSPIVKKSKMKKTIFRALAKLNKAILPSYSKRQLDLSKASKLQLAIIGWRIYITKNALEQEKTTQW